MHSDIRREDSDPVVVSVTQGADGVWMVNEHGTTKSAISYFSTKWSAMKYAVRAARTKPNCQIRIMDTEGKVESSRMYAEENVPEADRHGRPSAV